MAAIEIRELQSEAEYQQCVALQRATWGDNFSELVPAAILKVSQYMGGVAAGAFNADGQLLGFVFGVTGIEPAGDTVVPVHWSDMLAVREDARNQGIGERLKRYQREVLLGRGVRTIYWTFDPLDAKNAYMNFVRLGVHAREYRVDMYGSQTDSPLHHGIGTDRLIVIWATESARVMKRLAREPIEVRRSDTEIEIPLNIHALKETDPQAARAWRERTRAGFHKYLQRGYVVADFVREETRGVYVLLPASDFAA